MNKSMTCVIGLLVASTACTGEMPPPPLLQVTSPTRGLMQDSGRVVVKGIASPNVDGDPVDRVTVNGTPATLAADGSFSATIDVAEGASLIMTVATTDMGGAATDARSVQSGARHAIGTNLDRAVTASLSTKAFARLSDVAGAYINSLDLPGLLAPMQPMANVGDSIANVKLSITNVALGDIKIKLTPTDAGLMFSADVGAINIGASAQYAGALVPDGTTTIGATADAISITGTLQLTPSGVDGFKASIAAPSIKTTALKLQANGLAGRVLDLVNGTIGNTLQNVALKAAEKGIEPLMNQALGALSGPRRIDVLGKTLEMAASPAAIVFSNAGAQITMNIAAKLADVADGPGFIMTPNGTPEVDPAIADIQVGLADDLINEMLAEVYAMGLLDIHVTKDFGYFDTFDVKLAVPPMISADNDDGSLRIILGDMIGTISGQGKPLVSVAINALADLTIVKGSTVNQVGFHFENIQFWANAVAADPNNPDAGGEIDISGAAGQGIGIQLESLKPFFLNVPMPEVAGVKLGNLEMHADAGYMLVSGDIN